MTPHTAPWLLLLALLLIAGGTFVVFWCCCSVLSVQELSGGQGRGEPAVSATLDERIDAGVAWLDANVPDWLDRIDLDRLDLADTCKCVLGQTFAHIAQWDSYADEPGQDVPGYDLIVECIQPDEGVVMSMAVPYLSEDPADYGFSIAQADESFDALTAAWRTRITTLRSERQGAPA